LSSFSSPFNQIGKPTEALLLAHTPLSYPYSPQDPLIPLAPATAGRVGVILPLDQNKEMNSFFLLNPSLK
jgi:hypothetical protein